MKIFKFFVASLFLITAYQPISAQKMKLSGYGKGYQGAELKIYYQSDPVSKSLVPISRINCDSEGHFECELSIRQSDLVIIKTGIYHLSLYIDTIRDLYIKLPDFIAKTAEEEQNSYFAATKSIPEVPGNRSNINNLISAFDSVYNPIFNRVADRVMYNVKRKDIPSLIEKLNSFSSKGAPSYFNDFIRFRLVMLNQVASGEYPGRKEDSLLINLKFSPENQAYTDLIEQMFTKYLNGLSGGRLKESFNHALLKPSVSELKQVIFNDGKVTNEQLLEYIIIMNLFDEYYGSTIIREKVIAMLEELKSRGSSEYIRNIAGTIVAKLTMLGAGTIPPFFSLRDDKGEMTSVKDLKGKYLILSFARSDNAFSVSEYGILKSWALKFRDDLNVVTILRDNDYNTGLKRFHNFGFNWVILDGSEADMTEYLYDVVLYPSFLLLDREGKIIVNPCPFPSENLEALIGKKIAEEMN